MKRGNRSILVLADGYVVDGHHQWLAALEAGEEIPTMKIDAPARHKKAAKIFWRLF